MNAQQISANMTHTIATSFMATNFAFFKVIDIILAKQQSGSADGIVTLGLMSPEIWGDVITNSICALDNEVMEHPRICDFHRYFFQDQTGGLAAERQLGQKVLAYVDQDILVALILAVLEQGPQNRFYRFHKNFYWDVHDFYQSACPLAFAKAKELYDFKHSR